MRVCLTAYQLLAYFLSFFLFGSGGLLLSLFCLLLGWLPGTPRVERFFQRVIHWHFSLWLWWLRQIRLFSFTYEGFERLPRGRGLVLVANHPGLMDIIYLLARLPEAVCIFKPGIGRNPVLGAAARSAGYLANDGGIDLPERHGKLPPAHVGHGLVGEHDLECAGLFAIHFLLPFLDLFCNS